MQADYTRKTQEVSELRKLGIDASTAQEALDVYQNLQNPEFQQALYERLGEVFNEGDAEMEPEFDDPRDQQLAELTQRIESWERQQAQVQAETELARQESVIRAEHPDWADEDFQAVAQLAIANGGNMIRGAEVYTDLQSRVLKSHLEKKASVPATASAPTPRAHAEAPKQAFSDLDEAHRAAMRYWQQSQE